MPTQRHNPKVDAYIKKSRPFAQPILVHLRKLVHAGCPQVEETIKWSRPFFEYRGVILCNMSAFKEHCSLGFWGLEIGAILRQAGVVRDGAMGSLGRITGIASLPPEKKMIDWVAQAAALIESGQERSPIAARCSLLNRLFDVDSSCAITSSSAVCCVSASESCVEMVGTSACIRLVCAVVSCVCSLVTASDAASAA
jgi:hypothetical protein